MPPTAGSSTASTDPGADPRFFLDLGAPECLLAAERVLQTMPVATPWTVVDLGAGQEGFDWERLEATAAERGLMAIRRPPPFDATLVNRAATYAAQGGRVVAFCLAALRQAYNGGRDLSLPDHVAIAGSACELHPRALLKGVETRLVRDGLARATEEARALGVERTPAVWVPGARTFHGDDEIDLAASVAAEQLP